MAFSLLTIFLIAANFLPLQTLSHSDTFFYAGFKHQNSNITSNGTAKINQNGILTLTDQSDRLSSGHAFHRSPLRFKNSINDIVFSFSTSFAFAIVPESPKLSKRSGQGFTFAVASFATFSGRAQYFLGLPDIVDGGSFSKHVLVVEFDTFENYEFRDMNDNHVGVDVGGLVSKVAATAVYEKQELFLKSGKVMKAWIDYDSMKTRLSVAISPDSSKPRKPILSYEVDLSVILNEYMYVGFSAATSLHGSSHYILGWSFMMNGEARELDLDSLPSLYKLLE